MSKKSHVVAELLTNKFQPGDRVFHFHRPDVSGTIIMRHDGMISGAEAYEVRWDREVGTSDWCMAGSLRPKQGKRR